MWNSVFVATGVSLLTSISAWPTQDRDGIGLGVRSSNGLALAPPMGWNTYNHYSCSPNQTIVESNAKALVDLGLMELGYNHVELDCGWTVANRLSNGSLTWNAALFPSGIPAISSYVHSLGLKWGMYEDGGIYTCSEGIQQAGSLGNETIDAKTLVSWGIDSLKYDNCYSDAATGYPDVDYSPSTSPQPHYQTMANALASTGHNILFRICEWGIAFPSQWAPAIGNTWRVTNDIIPAWRTVFRILNQAVPSASFAGSGQWPDLDMLEVGNNVFTQFEEQTHFTLWAIMKSPLIIGAALQDAYTSISASSLAILKQTQVISYNQDSLGKSANLTRRFSDAQYDVWSGPLSNNRTVVAVINWADEGRDLTLELPDVGIQYAGSLQNIWGQQNSSGVRTNYTNYVNPHGVMLLELDNTIPAGVYPATIFATTSTDATTFTNIYGSTSSYSYMAQITFSKPPSSSFTVSTNAGNRTTVPVPSGDTVSVPITLLAGPYNTITISAGSVSEIVVAKPTGTFVPCTSFTPAGSATSTTCGSGYCAPVGTKIGYISPTGSATVEVPVTIPSGSSLTSKYVEINYINNDIAFASSFEDGTNSRNITIQINNGQPVRLETPLSGRHSEINGPGLGWWDTATLAVLTSGWVDGQNSIIIGNVNGEQGSQSYGADFVGITIYE